MVAPLARLAAREQRQGEGVDEQGNGGVAAALPFAEVFGAGAEFAGREVAQAVVAGGGEAVGTGQAQVGVLVGEEGGVCRVVVGVPGEAAAVVQE